MDRKELRKKLLEQRKLLPESMLREWGEAMTNRLLHSAVFRSAKTVHCFSGVTSKGEVSTALLIQTILDQDKILIMPRISRRSGHLEHHRVENLSDLSENHWGILEPAPNPHAAAAPPPELIIVPGLAADLSGNRLGYGKGYYDRFLSGTAASRVMLVPEIFVLEHLPAAPHDVPVHMLVTETRWVNCFGKINEMPGGDG